jgi:DNA-binding transcriptional LysR family regulator
MASPFTRLDLNLFRVMDAVYEHGGISGAARHLHLSQPAVSHALARLRRLWDDPLFVRQGNSMVPTELTRRVIGEVQAHLRGLQSLMAQADRFDPATLDMTLRVGMRDVLEAIALPPLIARLALEAPRVHLTSVRVPRDALERTLTLGEVDLVIDRQRRVGERIRGEHLADETLAVLMHADHPLADGPVNLDDYFACQHVMVALQAWKIPPILEELQAEGPRRGLWNLFLPDPAHWAPASSTAGVRAVAEAGPQLPGARGLQLQRARHRQHGGALALRLRRAESPLARAAAGRRDPLGLRMTEPDVASSDATNMQATARSTATTVVLSARSGGRAAWGPALRGRHLHGAYARRARGHHQHSMVLVPLDTPGVRDPRMLPVLATYDEPHGHGEVHFDDVRCRGRRSSPVPAAASRSPRARLGPGRIHHCMRCIGAAEEALELA